MSKKSNNHHLKIKMIQHNLHVEQLAEMLAVSETTVRSWRYAEGTSNFRRMPDSAMKLLNCLLKQRK